MFAYGMNVWNRVHEVIATNDCDFTEVRTVTGAIWLTVTLNIYPFVHNINYS